MNVVIVLDCLITKERLTDSAHFILSTQAIPRFDEEDEVYKAFIMNVAGLLIIE